MTNLFVPNTAEAGDLFEDSFIETHPALGLRLTSNSGAYWGDGDARPTHVDYGQLSFALEGKVRLDVPHAKRPKKHCKPTAAEWRKAMGDSQGTTRDAKRGQLQKFDPSAIRLFAVYNVALSTYNVFIPESDAYCLTTHLGLSELSPTETLSFRRRNGTDPQACRFAYLDWAELYNLIESVVHE